jgi:hypothetical protein
MQYMFNCDVIRDLLFEINNNLLDMFRSVVYRNNSKKLIQLNTTIYYDKGGQGYMFRPRFEAIFRPFVVEKLIKFLHMIFRYEISYVKT